MKSLQGRLFAVLGVAIALCWAVSIAVLLVYTSGKQASIWDGKLQTIATKVLLMVPRDKLLRAVGPGLQLRSDALGDNEKLTLQVWLDRARRPISTPGAPAAPLNPSFVDGFSTQTVDGQVWRVYSVSDSTGRVSVQAANPQSVVQAETRKKALIALAIVTALVALVGGLMAWAVRLSLRPVVAIESALRGRAKLDLTPLPAAPLPAELHPLVDAFNGMLERLGHAVEAERRLIGDAAHELRTPLAALQAQAQVALKAGTLAGKDAALVKLLAVAERSSRLSEQLLDLARLDAGRHSAHAALADLSELIVHVVREFDVHAAQHGRVILLEARACQIACDIDEIGILLRNLIDNALRYTGAGGRVRVSCGYELRQDRRFVCLDVADDGPGVPELEREAIFRRFHRLPGNGGRGSGIGLSLVAGIAQLHGATIETGTGLDGHGLLVRVRFPAPAKAPANAGGQFAGAAVLPATV